MNVKGFILEDDQGRQFVMVCEPQHMGEAKTFEIRGWQRRRLVPLHCTEQERRQIVAGVLFGLKDLFKSIPTMLADLNNQNADKNSLATQLLRTMPNDEEGDHVVK